MRVNVVGTEYRNKSLDSGSISKGLLFFCVFSTTHHPSFFLDYPPRKTAAKKKHPAAAFSQREHCCAGCKTQSLGFWAEKGIRPHTGKTSSPFQTCCWLRYRTELAERLRAVTASREHARFRRKLYTISLSWICSAVNERCGCTQQNYE